MQEGGTSIRRKKRSNFSLHLFSSFWHNFEEQIIELLKRSVFAKETLSIIQFFNAAKLLLADYFLFSMCLTNPLQKVEQNLVNIQTYKHISKKRISGSAARCSEEQLFQRNRSILSKVIVCVYLTAICHQNIPAFHIL